MDFTGLFRVRNSVTKPYFLGKNTQNHKNMHKTACCYAKIMQVIEIIDKKYKRNGVTKRNNVTVCA